MIQINTELCTGCGACVRDCISDVIELINGKASVTDACMQCGHCIALCPHKAPSISNYSDPCIEYDSNTFDIPTQNMVHAIKFRRSVRQFKADRITYDDLHVLMDAAAHTPTAKNTQSCRFVFIQEGLDHFKNMIWGNLRKIASVKQDFVIPSDSIERFLGMKDAEESQDYLFRNAPAVLCIQAPDPLDAGLAASAIEMVGATMGIGVLYNGYLRRTIEAMDDAKNYLDMDLKEKPLAVCMLLGYSDVAYKRTAPRRNPSVCLR